MVDLSMVSTVGSGGIIMLEWVTQAVKKRAIKVERKNFNIENPFMFFSIIQ